MTFLEALRTKSGLEEDASVATDSASLRRVALAFCEASSELGVRLDMTSGGFIQKWPEGLEERDGSVSLDSFVVEKLQTYAGDPVVTTALGATWTLYLMDQLDAIWVGGERFEPSDEPLPTSVRITGGLGIAFPFAHAREALSGPSSGFWSKLLTFSDVPPRRGLAATMSDAQTPAALDALLPPGGAILLRQMGELSGTDVLTQFNVIAEAHPDHAAWWQIGSSLAFQADDLPRAITCARRFATLHDNVNARYHLGDILSCATDRELLEEAASVLDGVLKEQPMMYRAMLKRAYALVDLNRRDEATTLLHEVANQGFGQDAEEATAALAQLGV